MCCLGLCVNRFALVFALSLYVGKSESAVAPFESPCPEIFQYMTDERNVLYGSIQAYRPFDSVIQLNVEISVGNSIQGYNGHIELGYSRLKAIEDIMNRRPLRYKLHFPVWMNIPPRITKISVNRELICTGPAIDIKTVPVLTTVNLQHTLRINVTPGSTGTTPEIRVDPPSRRTDDFFANGQTPENTFTPTNVQFRPQPPKDPEKVYPTNPFLNFLPQNTIGGVRNTFQIETTPTNRNDIVPISEQIPATTPKISPRYSLSSVCGKSLYANTNTLVAFGRPAGRGQFPWLAAIYTIKTSGLEFTCGGNLVSTKHVVTAAHCMKQQDRKLRLDQVLIILGKYNIQKWTNGEGLFLNAQRISIHPDYKPRNADADLAVITLEEEVQFTDLIRPICLWAETAELGVIVGQKGTVIGWGKDENGLLISPEPKQISLPVVSQEECIRSHDTFFDITSERTFCAGFKNGSGPCNGDSGGGFIMQRSGQWRLRGVVSMSLSDRFRSCDLSQYVVFTDVSKFSDCENLEQPLYSCFRSACGFVSRDVARHFHYKPVESLAFRLGDHLNMAKKRTFRHNSGTHSIGVTCNMEAKNRYKKSTNPFEDDDDDVDDETFLQNSRRPPHSTFDDQIQSLQEKRKEIENRTIQSTERSISILRDSEQIGIATAEELMRQREQLERTDKRLDEINATLRFSQKHINGIKSVFSSLKNFVSGKTDSASPTSISGSDSSQQKPVSNMEETVSGYDRYENHPATRLRNPDLGNNIPSQNEAFGSKNISAKLDANLQEMCTSISRLKGLATDLSLEIDSQNDLIGNITDKTEVADLTVQKQNKEMQRILKK